MSLEALKANMKPYRAKLHEVRGFSGAVRCAEAIRRCVKDGDLAEGRIKCKVQDAYSMRSTPQVIGAAHDALEYARSQVEIELNGVGDNPIFFPDEGIQISRKGEKVELHSGAIERIKKCRAMLEKKIVAREVMYGVNTGIGEFSELVLTGEQVEQFQKYLIYNHAAGIGDPAPIEYVRGAMAARINVHAHGNSGCRLEITQTLVEMLNKGVTPYVC